MDLLSARQKVTASNIANADTPGYKTKDINFAGELSAASSASTPHAQEVQGMSVKTDGNNVSIDREARNLAENSLRFRIAAQFLQGEFRAIRAAIQEGRQ
ncbi:MAG: flagellar biosynthesis protein FlgB [Bryobacteraceae bacterium]|nr:flagellar biosynthesis protein FlgB [Bryobacteraceae bacterium]